MQFDENNLENFKRGYVRKNQLKILFFYYNEFLFILVYNKIIL